MTDNLIEEARKVLDWYDEPHSMDEVLDVAIELASMLRRVLAVFEKAHAPTDDEREGSLYCPFHGDLLSAPRSYRCHNAPKGHEFRRSEVPEPSDEAVNRGTFGHAWPCPLFYVGNWSTGGPDGAVSRVECTSPAVCAAPEPQGEPTCCDVPGGPERCVDCPLDREQGEPSDAQVQAALDAWFTAVDDGTYSVDAMRAALRAAGEVKR